MGPNVNFTNQFNREMNILERITYETYGSSIGLGTAGAWNSSGTKKTSSVTKAIYNVDIINMNKEKNILIVPGL